MDWSQVNAPGRGLARDVIALLVKMGFVEDPTDSRVVRFADTVAQLVRERLPMPPHIVSMPRRRDALVRRLEYVTDELGAMGERDTRRHAVEGERIALLAAIECLDYVGRIR